MPSLMSGRFGWHEGKCISFGVGLFPIAEEIFLRMRFKNLAVSLTKNTIAFIVSKYREVDRLTKGQTEAKLSEAVSAFEISYMGRGPKEIKTTILSGSDNYSAQGLPKSGGKKAGREQSGS